MTREQLGEVLQKMAADGQPKENMDKVAAHYQGVIAKSKEAEENPHKNSDGTWKTVAQIEEEQFGTKKEKGSQTTDATVEPQIVSEGTESPSEDGSSESQPQGYQPNTPITDGGYEYKFDVNKDGLGVYYTRKVGENDWINVSETQPGSAAEVSIASEFGHADFDKSAYFKQKKEIEKQKEEEERRTSNPTSFADIGMTKDLDGSLLQGDFRYVFDKNDQKWYKQPKHGIPVMAVNQKGDEVSEELVSQINSLHNDGQASSIGIKKEGDMSSYLYAPIPPMPLDIDLNVTSKNDWEGALHTQMSGDDANRESIRIKSLGYDDEFDIRNTKTWVNMEESAFESAIENAYPGISVEQTGAGNAAYISVPWSDKKIYVDLKPEDGLFGSSNDEVDKVLRNFKRRYLEEVESGKINNSLSQLLNTRGTGDTFVESDVVKFNDMAKEIDGLNLSVTEKFQYDGAGDMIAGYEVFAGGETKWFETAPEVNNFIYENMSSEDVAAIHAHELKLKTSLIKERETYVDDKYESLEREEVLETFYKDSLLPTMMFDLGESGNHSGMSQEGMAIVKNYMEVPLKEKKMVPNPIQKPGQPPLVEGEVTVEDWERKKYEVIKSEMKKKLSPKDYALFEEYISKGDILGTENMNKTKLKMAEDSGKSWTERQLDKGNKSIIKDNVNKTLAKLNREKNDIGIKVKKMNESFKLDVKRLNVVKENLALTIRDSGAGVTVTGEGDNMVMTVSHPDAEVQKKLQAQLNDYQRSQKTISSEYKTTYESVMGQHDSWMKKNMQDLKTNQDLQEFTSKEYDFRKIIGQEFTDGFESMAFSIPAIFGNDYSIDRVNEVNASKSNLKTALTYDQAVEFGEKGEFALRTTASQGANTIVAIGSSMLGIPPVWNTALLATSFGLSAGGQTRADLTNRVKMGEEADEMLTKLEEQYKSGSVPYEQYRESKLALQKTIAAGDISPTQLLGATWTAAAIEGGVMAVLGTIPNSMKLVKDFSGSIDDIGRVVTRGRLGLGYDIAKGLTTTIGGEVLEETIIYAGNEFSQNMILNGNLKDADWSQFDDTFVTSVIMSGPMSGPGVLYSNVVGHVQTKQARTVYNDVMQNVSKIENMMKNLKPGDVVGKEQLAVAWKTEMEKLGPIQSGMETDAINLGSDKLKNLIKNNINLTQLHSEANIKPTDSEATKEAKIKDHVEGLKGEEKSNFEDRLKLANDNINKIKSSVDYGKEGTAMDYDVNPETGDVNGGIIYNMFGSLGIEVGNALAKKDPKFEKLSNREQAGLVLEEIKNRQVKANDKRIRDNKAQVEAVEKSVYDGLTWEEWKNKNNKKNRRKAQEDAEYTRRSNSLLANETEAVITATEQNNNAKSILGDERLKSLQILNPDNGDTDGKFTKEEIEMKIREELSDNPAEANRIIQGLRKGSTNGVIVNNKYIALNPEAAREQMKNGNLLAGTVLSHEISHFIDDAVMTKPQRVDYANKLNAYMASEMPAIDREAIHLLEGLADDSPAKWESGVPFEGQSPTVKDEYTKRVQDVLQQDRNAVYKKKVQKQGRGVGKNVMSLFNADFNIKSPNDAAAWVGSYLTGFENGELGKLQKRKFDNTQAQQTNDQGFRESSNLQGTLDTRSQNPTKRDVGRMVDEMISLKPNGDYVEAGGLLQSELGQQLGGMMENTTRRLYDNIPDDAKRTVSRNDYKEALLMDAYSMIKNEYDPSKQDLDAFVSSRLNLRANALATALGIESSIEEGGGGIALDANEVKDLEGDLGIDDVLNIETIENPTYPLTDNMVMSNADAENVNNSILLSVGTELPAIDAQVSKNKFTTPFIAALKKAFGVKGGPLHVAVQNMMGKTPAEIDRFLTDPVNKQAILDALPTGWLSKNIPAAVEKSVNGTRIDSEDGKTTILTPNWTPDWKGQKIDRWNAKDEGPYRGNTAGPPVVRRNPKAIETVSNADLRSKFVKGKTMTELNRNGLTKLQLAIAQEIGLELFKKDIKADGPLTEVFKQRQDVFDRVLAENYAEEISRQMERGTAKLSENPETELNITRGSVIVDEANNLVKEVIQNYNKDLQFGGLEAALANYSPEMINAFESMGIFEMFNTDTKQGFVKPTKAMDWLSFENQKAAYTDNGTQSTFMKDQQAKQAEVMIDILPPQVVRVLGKEFFGMTSARQLDAARNKQDGTQGKYVYLDDKLIRKAAKKDTNVKLPFDPLKLEMLNSGSGLMVDIQKIQNMDLTVEEKQKRLEALQPRIDDANANNKKFLTWYATQNAIAIAKNPDLAIGLAGQMQGATNNVKGFRAYTNLGMIKLQKGSQAPYLTRAGKPTNVKPTNKNGGYINRNHPDFTRALELADGNETKAAGLLKYKGEHIDPSANVMQELFASTLELADILKTTPEKYHDKIVREHQAKMDNILTNFDQSLGPIIDSKIQDSKLGSTSRLGWARNFSVSDQIKNYYNTNDGGGVDNVIKSRTTQTLQVLSQKARIGNEIVSKATQVARSSENPTRGITVLDFDDTLATSNSLIRFTRPDGTTGTLNAEQYAKTYEELTDLGYKWDFSEFNKVVGGKIAPLFQKALKLQGKFGPENMFVLTARPPQAAKAIFDFLSANGLNIPMENITGLANSTAEAKALWIADKVGEGYNDFYFADDALQNVQAVDNMLEQFDVKRKVQQAKLSENPSDAFNVILEETMGEGREKIYSEAKAQIRGAEKGKYKFFIPPSAEDFKGLLYSFLGKGKKGEAHMDFFQKTLIQPFARAQRELDSARQSISNDYQALKKDFKGVTKNLNKKMPGSDYTLDQGIRVLLWDRAGFDIPGLSKTDKAEILKAVNNNPDAVQFANTLSLVSKQDNGYSKPGDFWTTESIASDLNDITNTIGKDQFLTEFKENREQVFGKWVGGKLVGPNMNKIEALYGSRFREALTDMVWRMENGSNRNFGSNRLTNQFANWVNNSVGAIMFFNARSAVLQTLSSVNFINWGDNNAFKAAKAFANQPQFWSDFARIFNSDMLKQRRSGLRTDVSQSEIAQAAGKGGNKVKAVMAYLLKKGFLPTQIADSFAIASGGATFFRNRTKTYMDQGMSKADAESKAFIDFQEIAEETQQSSRPDLISQQQASPLGRLILAFQNTPMQYARLTKKSVLDLANGRGDFKTNVSKILYYGAIQNAIFSSLQKAMFAFAFDDDTDEEKEKQKRKELQVLNGMVDSLLRGMGVGGAIVSTAKNMIMAFAEQNNSRDFDYSEPLIAMLNLSPPVGSKARKILSAGKTFKYKKDEIMYMDKLDIDNPMWNSIGNVVSSTTNIPLDRVINKVNNLKEVIDQRNSAWQKLALSLGWNTWDLGVENEEFNEAEKEVAKIKKEKSEAKRKAKREEQKRLEEIERKKKEARMVQCSARIRKGKGPRCKNKTENKNGKCYAHQ